MPAAGFESEFQLLERLDHIVWRREVVFLQGGGRIPRGRRHSPQLRAAGDDAQHHQERDPRHARPAVGQAARGKDQGR